MKNVKNNLLLGCGVVSTSLMLSANIWAGGCISSDCNAMGYTLNASSCGDLPTVKCPFDTNKVFCSKEVCEGFTKGTPSCSDGQTMTLCTEAPDNYYKCSGTACESGYSTASVTCSSSQCKDSQDSNSKCKRCITAGSCTGYTRAEATKNCPRDSIHGIRIKCHNNCGTSYYECCKATNDCLVMRPDPSMPSL